MISEEKTILNEDKQQPIKTLVILGFLVFSPFSTILIMNMFGFPTSLPELLFLPFLILFRKRYHFSSTGLIRTIIFISSWILLILISLLVDNYSLSAILSTSRSYLTLIIAYLLFSKENNVSLDDIMYVSFGATLGWLFSSIYGINSLLKGDAEAISMTGNMIAIPLLLGIAAFKKHNKILIFSIVLCIAISITAGMRRQIAVFLMSLFLTYSFLSLQSLKQFLSKILMLAFPVLIFIIFLPQIKTYIKTNIPVLYFRVFDKTEMMFSGNNDASGDNLRLDNMGTLVNNLIDYFIPRGFVSRRMIVDGGGAFIDFPLSELLYMLGIFLTILLLTIFIIYTVRCYFQSKNTNNESIIFVIVSIIMFMLLFLEGTFLSSSYTAPLTGFCLGRLKYHSKLTFILGKKINQTNTNDQ